LDDSAVIRAGFGTSIIPFPDNRYAFNFPVKQNNQFNPPNQFAAAGSMAAGLPAPQAFSVPNDGIIQATTPTLLNQGFFFVPPNLREARLHSYNIAYQRELFWGLTGEVAYVGNIARGVHRRFQPECRDGAGSGQRGPAVLPANLGRSASVQTWYPTDTNYNSTPD
jgi:hypothetical protein